MRLLVLSDLHLELWREHAPRIAPSNSQPDVVILAGDISTGAKAVEWASRLFSGLPVLYVHGNHEAYGRNLENTQEEIMTACTATENVHFLNCREFELAGVRFLGATMWTDFRLFGDDNRQVAMQAAEDVMVDYKRIRLAHNGYRKLRASDTAKLHAMHKSWLKQKLAERFSGATVVITHMAPSLLSIADRFATDPVSASYASRLDELVTQTDIWIHGHTHDSFDYRIGKCRVVCNPCGYMTRSGDIENSRFDPNFIVEIGGNR
jgi:predicted phosphodiesterase